MEKETNWPAWFYGPNGAAEVFESAKEVPAGWKDHPSKVSGSGNAEKPADAPVPAKRGRKAKVEAVEPVAEPLDL